MLAGKIKKTSTRSLWIEVLDGFQVNLPYITRHELRAITEASQEEKFDVKEQTIRRVRSEELFAEQLAKRIHGWKGLTGRVLRALVEMNEADYPPEEEQIPFTVEDCKELLLNSLDFQLKVEQVVYNLQVFEQARRAALKNGSAPSHAEG